MRKRVSVIAAAIGATLVLGASGASADPPISMGPQAAPNPAPAVPALDFTGKPPAVGVIPVDQMLSQPLLRGEAWTRAVRAVIEGVRQAMGADRAAVQKVVTAAAPATPKSAQPSVFRAVLPPTVREMVDTAPVKLGPVPAESAGAGTYDRRGERAALLGASIDLPWMVP